jgi:hypothetical protein
MRQVTLNRNLCFRTNTERDSFEIINGVSSPNSVLPPAKGVL